MCILRRVYSFDSHKPFHKRRQLFEQRHWLFMIVCFSNNSHKTWSDFVICFQSLACSPIGQIAVNFSRRFFGRIVANCSERLGPTDSRSCPRDHTCPLTVGRSQRGGFTVAHHHHAESLHISRRTPHSVRPFHSVYSHLIVRPSSRRSSTFSQACKKKTYHCRTYRYTA